MERFNAGRLIALISIIAFGVVCGPALADEKEQIWASLKPDVFGDRPIVEDDILTMDAPMRAEDAAITPIDVTAAFLQTDAKYVKSITLIVDANPAPVVASFSFGPAAAQAAISTRVRVDSYSFVRAIAEMNDGSLHMVKKFVKASGGCSAPASKDADKALAEMGKMRLRQFPAKREDGARDAQIMIRHPNFSGLQMDQITRTYRPAHFVRDLEVLAGGALAFRMEGGISLSEDPNIRFRFKPGLTGDVKVIAKDTEGNVFEQAWPIEAAGS